MLELARTPRRRVRACRRGRPDHGARALADAGALRRLERLLRLRAASLPERRASQGRLSRRARRLVELGRGRRARRRDRPPRVLLDSRSGARTSTRCPAEQRGHRRARRRRAVRVERALSRARTACSAAPTFALVGPDNPLGLDRDDAVGKDDITSSTAAQSAGRASR